MQVGAIGCADFSKPFILPTGSTFKDIGGRANVVAVVYVPDPVGQLMPAQVSNYGTHIGRILSMKLPLRPVIATGPNSNWEVGTASSTPNPHLMNESSSPKSSDDDYETISTYPTGPNLTAFGPTFTPPLQGEGSVGLRRTPRRRAGVSTFSLSSHLDLASSTTQSQVGNLRSFEARNVEARDVGCVASGQVMAQTITSAHETGEKQSEGEACGSFNGRRLNGIVDTMEYALDRGTRRRSRSVVQPSPWSDASSEDSGSTHVLYAISPRADGIRSPRTLECQSSPFNAQRSPQPGGADRAAEALQEAEDAFMAADLKYNAAREAQDLDCLDPNEPYNVSSRLQVTYRSF